jgi:hypothetical protein
MSEHAPAGTREVEASNYCGKVFACSCGERFEDLGELEQHIGPPSLAEIYERNITRFLLAFYRREM